MNEINLGSQASVAEIRPVHYMGNKSRFLDAIEAAVSEVAAPGTAACDLFAGTAVVARRLAMSRPVICSDIQAYSTVFAQALTQPRAFTSAEVDSLKEAAQDWLTTTEREIQDLLRLEERAMTNAQTDPGALADIIENGSLAVSGRGSMQLQSAKESAHAVLRERTATLTRYYGGVYFSYRQAAAMDALRNAFKAIWGDVSDVTALAALLGVASDLVSTVGSHFAQPVQPRTAAGKLKRNWIAPVTRRRGLETLPAFDAWLARYASLPPALYECRAVQADYQSTLATLGPEVGVIYADPPYTRDHYSRFYHVLETIAIDDDPGVTPAQGSSQPSRGLYREDRHQSPFSIRTQVVPAFQELFANAKRLDVPLVLSYSPMSEGTKARPETRLVSIDSLMSLASDYFANVRLLTMESSSHSRFNRVEVSAEALSSAEVLIVGSN
ncbi:DNA adenine methylase [Arthrobacter cupressi]|uniref:site-specific DNA-methyltransferase (adenine-specific) n=1 Tax=Arthrobacter cupressi TaxID=1045773 RepID=A0A1G8JY99_9MICC|nr:DNA adenine methylase [Arthrobacter cupressi]NYD77397.1 site-specific DNA-adenine methylase [Arthrobacter cupressi]SDI36109.1 D12 class N6 adenine-specific DNA methyltransferase [Arthrobacter cupressi]